MFAVAVGDDDDDVVGPLGLSDYLLQVGSALDALSTPTLKWKRAQPNETFVCVCVRLSV